MLLAPAVLITETVLPVPMTFSLIGWEMLLATSWFGLIFYDGLLSSHEQCCGSGMFIPVPGSVYFPSQIPDPHQRIEVFEPQKIVS